MSSAAASALLPTVRPVYPERAEPVADSWLDEMGDRIGGGLLRWWRSRQALKTDLVANVRACEAELKDVPLEALQERARELGKLLRRDGFEPALVARAFALVSRAAELTKNMRPFDVQLLGGYVLLQGMVAEMETGEGKTLTATLPACTAALAGVAVHVITVNDYLVTRDAALMKPVYAALGLSVGV